MVDNTNTIEEQSTLTQALNSLRDGLLLQGLTLTGLLLAGRRLREGKELE